MHPILEIGLSDTIDFPKSPSPQQQQRHQPQLASGRPHRRTVRLMASSHSSPIRPSSPTHELSPPRRRRRSSPKAKPVGAPGASAGNAAQRDNSTAYGEDATQSRLSLRRLKQGEGHQRIRHGASELLRLSESFPGYHGQSGGSGFHSAHDQALPSDSDLRHMAQLSHNIANDIFDIFALRNEDPSSQHRRGADSRRHHQSQSIAPGHASVMRKGGKGDTAADFYCHKCHRVDTPQWRLGPDGPMTLCNVCGLVYAKRQQNLDDLTMPGSPSMNRHCRQDESS
ncbi:GATA zinc finger domain-containing protein 7 [Colletotrichum siamense]|nr:GATA zinc finger domain-containing protein 7 [Colletotrichum siamense]